MVYWLSWHCESGIWYLSFRVPFPRHCLDFLVALGSLNRLRSCGWAWSRDSIWLWLASTVHPVAWESGFSPAFSSLHVCSRGSPTLCAQSRICGAAQTCWGQWKPCPFCTPCLPLYRLCLHDELFARLFVRHRKESVWSFPDLTDWGLQNFYLSPLLIDWILYSFMVKVQVPRNSSKTHSLYFCCTQKEVSEWPPCVDERV